MKTVSRRFQYVLFVAFLFLLFAHGSAEAQISKRLILKDGSYQLTSKWEVQGDRVRYLSTERNEWEEVPSSMVDWKATGDYEKEREAQRTLDLQHAGEEEKSEANAIASPVVAPGLHLPDSGGVFLLDTYNGELQLAELSQNSGELNRQTGRNILRGAIAPIAASKQSIELKGEHARIQSHVQQPAIFLEVDQYTRAKPSPSAERFRIARLEAKKDARVVSDLKVAITGKVSQHEIYLPATAEQLPGGWVKLTPTQPLSPGEYAVVEMLDQKTVNLYVWDFGVNPSSPANPDVWKAAPQSALPVEAASPPDLQRRSQ
jgi:hypothetical protein